MLLVSRPAVSLDLASLGEILPDAAPPYLLQQRWFGARSAPIRSVSVLDALPLPDPDLQAAHVLLHVELADGACSTWQLVLALSDPRDVDPAWTLAHIETPLHIVCLYDILRSPIECSWLLRALRRHHGTASDNARLLVEWTAALDRVATPYKVRPVDAEQSNSSIIVGQGAVFKLYRRLEPGINPDVEVTRALTTAGYDGVPAHLGSVSWERPGHAPVTLAAMQQYVSHEGDGWSDARRKLEAFLHDPSQTRLQVDTDGARALGETVARMHAALARVPGGAWTPEPVDSGVLQQWRDTMMSGLDRAAEALDSSSRRSIEALASGIPSLSQPGTRQRIHGDLHLGQVLKSERGWIVFDFEGEPSRPLAERAAKHSPVRDVAGMLRSYDYAAFASLFALATPTSAPWQRLEPVALRWESAMRDAFLSGWKHAAAGLAPPDDALTALIEIWELDKAIYELRYELDHRPDWLPIPLRGIHRIISRKRV